MVVVTKNKDRVTAKRRHDSSVLCDVLQGTLRQVKDGGSDPGTVSNEAWPLPKTVAIGLISGDEWIPLLGC